MSPAKAAALLGISEADAASLARDLGWEEAPAGAGGAGPMLLPKASEEGGVALDSRAALDQLTQYMVHLES